MSWSGMAENRSVVCWSFAYLSRGLQLENRQVREREMANREKNFMVDERKQKIVSFV